MRVDLRLEGAHLGACGELLLELELVDGELRRNEVGKTRHKRVLRAVDRVRAAEIELERAHGVIAHLERSHDARGDQPGSPVLGTHLHRLGERLDDAVLNHVMRCRRMDGRAGRKILRHVAHAGENAALVGHSMVLACVSGSRCLQMASALSGVRPPRMSSSMSEASESVSSVYWERRRSGLSRR